MDDTAQWARQRDFPFGSASEWEPLRDAWNFSQQRLKQMATAIEQSDIAHSVCCVAVSGSLSRMEAHGQSDVDLLVVLNDSLAQLSEQSADELYDQVWSCLESSFLDESLRRPKPGGIFSVPARISRLTDAAMRGVVDEDVTSYGQRMQLLLDAQPIFRTAAFERLQTDLLTWYRDNHVPSVFGEPGIYHWFWQDIQRYWRSIRARACWLHADDPRKSLEINLKLRSSRLLIVTAMLLTIEDQFDRPQTTTSPQLSLSLRQTPLERICDRAGQAGDDLLRAYQTVWSDIANIQQNDEVPHEASLAAVATIMDIVARLPKHLSAWYF